MDPQTLKKLNMARLSRQAVMVITELQTGRDRIVLETDTVEGELGEHVGKAFLSGKSAAIELSGAEFFLNVHVPPPRIVVIGAVHISQALCVMAKTAGYAIEVIDPRTAFATKERFADTELFAEWPDSVLKDRPLDRFCALAAVTHDPKIDDFPIESALKADCFYVGALGSRKTHSKRLERLKASGFSDEELSKIHSPIGIDIGAASPQEIAVAIMAEIIGAFHRRKIGHAAK